MGVFVRLLRFTGFTLLEYVRSGRFLIEAAAASAFFYFFLFQRSETGLEGQKFFSLSGLFSLALTIYTMSSMIGLGDRTQGYLVVTRRLGRMGYLLGLYLAACVVVSGAYGLVSLLTALLNPIAELTVGGWVLGSLPLLLNVALMAALLLMLSSLVFAPSWRLAVLGLIALAFSGNLISGPLQKALPALVVRLLGAVQTLLSWPLVPPFFAYELSVTRVYNGSAFAIILAQLSLIVALLGLSIYAFERRDLSFAMR